MKQSKLVSRFVIGTFVTLYVLVSTISTIHVIDFFELSNPYWLAVTLAIAFEIGAAASLASLVVLDKMNKGLIWALFIAITLMQMQGNMYYAFKNLENYQSWVELFNLVDEEPLYQKRILSLVSGAILPLVALGFIKSLVDYIKPEEEKTAQPIEETVDGMRKVVEAYDDLEDEIRDWEEASLMDFQENFEEAIEIEEEKAKIEEIIEEESMPEEEIEEMIEDVMEREEAIEKKIEKDLTNDYLLGKELYQSAVKKAFRNNAVQQARMDKLSKQEETINPTSVGAIVEEMKAEESKAIVKPKVSRTGGRGAGTVGMY
jgi:hypothetical protein